MEIAKSHPMPCSDASDQDSPLKSAELIHLREAVTESWEKIAPAWPVKNWAACNPLQGFEKLPIEQALVEGVAYFQQPDLPASLHAINRETIKWCQAFFDDNHSTISMPNRRFGFYAAWRELAVWDERLKGAGREGAEWLGQLPKTAEQALAEAFLKLKIPKKDRPLFLTLLLTTLPGWAAYIKYRVVITKIEPHHPYPVTPIDYLAVRLVTTALLWPQASELLAWHAHAKESAPQKAAHMMAKVQEAERVYHGGVLKAVEAQAAQGAASRLEPSSPPTAQLAFCIDIRSEPFRRALEAQGRYETFSCAGFFGLFLRIHDELTGEVHSSCPGMLAPKYSVIEKHQARGGESRQKKGRGLSPSDAF